MEKNKNVKCIVGYLTLFSIFFQIFTFYPSKIKNDIISMLERSVTPPCYSLRYCARSA